MVDPVRRLAVARAETELSVASQPPWLARLFVRIDPSPREWGLLSSLALASVPITLVGLVFFGVLAAAVGLVVTIGPVLVFSLRWRGRATQRMVGALPDALTAVARDLRTNGSFRSSVARRSGEAGPLQRHFGRVQTAMELGESAERACASFDSGSAAVADLATAATLLSVVAGGGRGGPRALDEGAAALRQRATVRAEVAALVAQAESSVRILASLPPLFVGLGIVTGQSSALVLFTTSTGRLCLVIGVVLDVIGLFWMRSLVGSVTA